MGRPAIYPRITVGERFGRLTVVEECEKLPYHDWEYVCRCDCGKETKTTKRKLQTGHSTSCGCHKRDSTMDFTYSESGTVCDERISSILNGHINKNNTSGVTGVRYGYTTDKGKKYYRWIAQISFKGQRHRKLCNSKEEAIATRRAWENELFAPIVEERTGG